jgi:hypothetical protein
MKLKNYSRSGMCWTMCGSMRMLSGKLAFCQM